MSQNAWDRAAKIAISEQESIRQGRVSTVENIRFLKKYVHDSRKGGGRRGSKASVKVGAGGGTGVVGGGEGGGGGGGDGGGGVGGKNDVDDEEERRLKEFFMEKRKRRQNVELTLRLCVEMKNHDRLKAMVDLARSVGLEGKRYSPFWKETLEALMMRAIDKGDEKMLRELLKCGYDAPRTRREAGPGILKDPLLIGEPETNRPVLINACQKGDEKLVKALVLRGYQLEFDFKKCKKSPGFSWSALRRFSRASDVENQNNVHFLQVLSAMSRPCYLFTCHWIATKTGHGRTGDEADCDLPSCKCRPRKNNQSQSTSRYSKHQCPKSKEYKPMLGCMLHAECNEPMFWCLFLAKAAHASSNKWPEYRQEYKDVAATCSSLAVSLLDLCQDVEEAKDLLLNNTGCDYFFGKRVQVQGYARLQMAIYNNDKDFVSQKYCQQILREVWYGCVPWQERSGYFKIYYVLVQALLFLLPWWVVMFIVRQTIQDLNLSKKLSAKLKEQDPAADLYNLSEEHMSKLNRRDRFIAEAMKEGNNKYVDEPLNRFINFSLAYLLFTGFIVTCVYNPIIVPDELRNNFQWYDKVLLVLTGSFILQDVYSLRTSMINKRGTTFWFWKVYDFLVELTLTGAFIVRWMMGARHECPDEECDQETLEERLPYDNISICMFAVASIMACTRLLYWVQLHDRMGPIIIQLSRVIIDVIAFIFVLVILLLSFTMALVPLKAINSRCDNYTEYFASDGDTTTGGGSVSTRLNIQPLEEEECWFDWDTSLFLTFFWTMLGLVFWGILNPEFPESAFSTETAEGLFAIAIYAIYCVLAIIVLLNLLIAIMNNTIQRVHDSKNTYWKFVRTSIWVEFFGDTYRSC